MEEIKMKSREETIPMELKHQKLARIEIMPAYGRPNKPSFFTLAADRLKVLWRSVIKHAGSKRKALSVRETAALGDRRFISVIQFERQRFLVGSSPASVTLLAQLPDQPQRGQEHDGERDKEGGDGIGDEAVKNCGQQRETERGTECRTGEDGIESEEKN
jgi:flagellar biogenesis protein FliO